MMNIKAVYIPITLHTKFSKDRQTYSNEDDIMESLFGNPTGTGQSSVPFLYCVHQSDLSKSLQPLYYLKLTFRWPHLGRFMDETQGQLPTRLMYEEYKAKGYIGVLRKFADTKRYVIFNPKDYLVRISDVDSEEILYENDRLTEDVRLSVPGDNWERVSDYFFKSGTTQFQQQINALMLEKIGPHFINIKRDFFNVDEFARRKGVSRSSVVKHLNRIIGRIKVNKVSGCWISNTKGDYRKTFWMAMGGLAFDDIFQFPQDVCAENTDIVIKNRDILHSPICETTFGSEHFRCCRPYHLKLGTSRENAVHIKVRKSLDQLFDFNYEEMQEYCFHILKLSNLIQRQVHVVTEDELKVMRRRKGNKVFYCEEEGSGKRWIELVGEPDMGDAKGDPDFSEITKGVDADEDDEKLWKAFMSKKEDQEDQVGKDKMQYRLQLGQQNKDNLNSKDDR